MSFGGLWVVIGTIWALGFGSGVGGISWRRQSLVEAVEFGGSWRRQSLVEAVEFGGSWWRQRQWWWRSLHLRKFFTFCSYYQDEGLYTVPHLSTLNLPPPSIAENQSLPSQFSPSHHSLIVAGEDGFYTVTHSPTLNLPPPSIAENQPLSFQHSPSHQQLFVTGENPSLSAPTVTLPYHLYREDGASGGAVTPRLLRLRRNSLQSPQEGKNTIFLTVKWSIIQH
ncbi:hypothetical protein Fot_39222 [Forsythia ovata]|uniref:Uncharacterized protein n=1 Tax=Forsythia ovata TaxID=205694 RepID=A0ABD1S458_9LAMI